MGKRGPKPRPSSERRGSPTGVRLPTELRQRLEVAAKKEDRSLSREIEHRLQASFGEDPKFEQLFGSFKTYWLFQQMSEAILLIENQTAKRWWKDRFTFDQMKSAIETGLEIFRPKGRSTVPKRMLREINQLPVAARVEPAKVGCEAMLIKFWSLDGLADQEADNPPRGYKILGKSHDKHAARFLGNDLVLDPMKALTKLKRHGARRP